MCVVESRSFHAHYVALAMAKIYVMVDFLNERDRLLEEEEEEVHKLKDKRNKL